MVGAFRHDSAYVFAKTGAGWNQVAELRGSGTIALFGTSVAISGATAVVGSDAAERAYVFTRSRAGWNQVAELKGSDTVEGPLSIDQFGVSAAISGTLAIVGARFHAKAGRAYVFEA
jgi:hypothetical protein